ncbi:MAG: hypothetical protein ACRECP_00745 [Methylocella sp.]
MPDEAGIRSDGASQRTSGATGQTPVVESSGRRQSNNPISPLNPQAAFGSIVDAGRMRAARAKKPTHAGPRPGEKRNAPSHAPRPAARQRLCLCRFLSEAHQGHLMRFAWDIWQHPRPNHKGRIFDTDAPIVDARRAAPNALTAETGRIASIGSRDRLSRIPFHRAAGTIREMPAAARRDSRLQKAGSKPLY